MRSQFVEASVYWGFSGEQSQLIDHSTELTYLIFGLHFLILRLKNLDCLGLARFLHMLFSPINWLFGFASSILFHYQLTVVAFFRPGLELSQLDLPNDGGITNL